MPERMVTIAVDLIYLYIAVGFFFAIAFVFSGVQKIDEQAEGPSVGFRFLIFPGIIAFWPVLLRRWRRASGQPPLERNPHQ